MALGSITPYRSFLIDVGSGLFNLDSDTFRLILTTSAYTPNEETHTRRSDVTDELTTAGGYTANGIAIDATWSYSAGKYVFDFPDETWTGSGAGFTARYWVLFKDTGNSSTSPLMFYGHLDATPSDVVITDGQNLNFNLNASGLFDIA